MSYVQIDPMIERMHKRIDEQQATIAKLKEAARRHLNSNYDIDAEIALAALVEDKS